jgi:hypothetical protein
LPPHLVDGDDVQGVKLCLREALVQRGKQRQRQALLWARARCAVRARRAAEGEAAGRTRRKPSWLTTSRVEYRPSRSDLTTTTFLPLPCGRRRGERTQPGD